MRPTQENDVFHAIAHPARRAILVTLKRGERSAGELAQPFHMTFPAISQHLRVLEEAELVKVRRDGRQRLYRLHPRLLSEATALIGSCACRDGCPSCVGPVGEIGSRGKAVARALLESLQAPRG